jgi:hypothetical protein
MAIPHRSRRTVSTKVAFSFLRSSPIAYQPNLLGTGAERNFPDASPNANSPSATAPVTIPAGTRFVLVLTNPVASRSIRRGEVYTQTVAPILVGDQIVVPPEHSFKASSTKCGEKARGPRSCCSRRHWSSRTAWWTNTSGPVHVEGEEGTAWLDADGKNTAGPSSHLWLDSA